MLTDILDFHALTENRLTEDADAAVADVPYRLYRKSYPRFPRIELGGGIDSQVTLRDALTGRESAREFASRPLDLAELDAILSTIRVTDVDRFPEKRTYASAGALFPIEPYVLAFDVAGLEHNTAYHLNMRLNALEELWPVPDECSRADLVTPDLTGCRAAIVLTSVLSRSAVKYGEKAYPFSYLEAGQILQNISLASTGAGLASCPVGGFIDGAVSSALDLPDDEIPLLVVALGHKPEDPAAAGQSGSGDR